MKDLSSLLQKFKNLGFEEHQIKDKFIEILQKKYNKNLTRKELDIKDRILIIKVSGPFKTEILLNKNKLLEELNSSLEKNIFDIR